MRLLLKNWLIKILIYQICINFVCTNVCLEKSMLPAYNQIKSFKLKRLSSIGCLSISKTSESQEVHVLKLVETTNTIREIDVYLLHKETYYFDPVKFSMVIISNYETKWRLYFNGLPMTIYVGNITSIWLNDRKISSKFKRLSKPFIKQMPQLNQMTSLSDLQKRFKMITSYTEIGAETNLLNINYLNEKSILPFCESRKQLNNSVTFKMEPTVITNCINTSNMNPNYKKEKSTIEAPTNTSSTNIIIVLHHVSGITENYMNVNIILNSPLNVSWTLLPAGDLKLFNLQISTNSVVDTSLLSCASLKISFQQLAIHHHTFFHTFLSPNSSWINLNLDASAGHSQIFMIYQKDESKEGESIEAESCKSLEVESDTNLSLLCAVVVSFVAFIVGVLFMSLLWFFHDKCLSNSFHIMKSSKNCSAETTGSTSPITIYQVNCN